MYRVQHTEQKNCVQQGILSCYLRVSLLKTESGILQQRRGHSILLYPYSMFDPLRSNSFDPHLIVVLFDPGGLITLC